MTPEDDLTAFPGEAHKVKWIADVSCPMKKLAVKGRGGFSRQNPAFHVPGTIFLRQRDIARLT